MAGKIIDLEEVERIERDLFNPGAISIQPPFWQGDIANLLVTVKELFTEIEKLKGRIK